MRCYQCGGAGHQVSMFTIPASAVLLETLSQLHCTMSELDLVLQAAYSSRGTQHRACFLCNSFHRRKTARTRQRRGRVLSVRNLGTRKQSVPPWCASSAMGPATLPGTAPTTAGTPLWQLCAYEALPCHYVREGVVGESVVMEPASPAVAPHLADS